jgi:hypothetical protein
MHSNDLLKKYIAKILKEAVTRPELRSRIKQLKPLVASMPGYKRVEIKKAGDGTLHIRIHFKYVANEPGPDPKEIRSRLQAFGNVAIKGPVKPGEAGSFSGLHDTWEVVPLDGEKEPFSIVISHKPQRGGGTSYEEKFAKAFQSARVMQTGDVKTTDVIIYPPEGHNCSPIKIEVKQLTARFGEPTLHYDFNSQKFSSSTSTSETGKLASDILNAASPEKVENDKWMLNIKNAFGLESEFTKIDETLWKQVDKSKIKTTGTSTKATPANVVNYYVEKNADYIQIEKKGLYSIKQDILSVGVPSFSSAIEGLGITLTPALRKSGGIKIRATFKVSLNDLNPSNMDLDNPADRDKFMKAVEDQPCEVFGGVEESSNKLKELKNYIKEVITTLK